MSHTVTVLPQGGALEMCTAGENLWSLLLKHQSPVEGPCGGGGTCGKCKVRITDGDAGPISERESAMLLPQEIADGYRLACMCYPQGDVTVELPKPESMQAILSNGLRFQHNLRPAVRAVSTTITKADFETASSAEALWKDRTGCVDIQRDDLHFLPTLPGSYYAVLLRDQLIAAGAEQNGLYGLAVDIGTTTVAMSLVDLETGEELATESAINPQNQFGQDVLSRIAYAGENGLNGVTRLQTVITDLMEELKNALCTQMKVPPQAVYEMTVGANSTMMHLLLGVTPVSMGRLPFAPVFTAARHVRWAVLRPATSSPSLQVYCLPAVSAYIGSDVVAGAFVADLRNRPGIHLLIDIGTNGEIVLACNGKLFSCSCAAGPALEGMNISCGMRAHNGAVEDIHIRNGQVELQVIGGGKPEGLCGSGVLAALRECLHEGIVKPGGALAKPQDLPEGSAYLSWLCTVNGKKAVRLGAEGDAIVLTQKDIRQIQLAKAAILSGFVALLRRQGLALDELDHVFIAGQFGAHLSVDSLIGCGILPAGIYDRVQYIGNTSKSGAAAALMDTELRLDMEALASSIEYVELGAVADYERLLIECMGFPPIQSFQEAYR